MASKRKPSGKPGKKSGARIKQHLAIMPLGVKGSDLELKARMSLLAFSRGISVEEDGVNLYTIAMLCQRIADEPYILRHADSAITLLVKAKARGWATLELEQASLEASMGVLIEWFHAHGNNVKIARAALGEMAKIERRA